MSQFQNFAELVASVMPHIQEVTVEEYQADDSWVLLDVREDNEWLKDHLPLAKHLGRGVLECYIETRFPDKTTPLLLYCGAGSRSALAAYQLQLMGYSRVASLHGGYKAWTARQLPLAYD